MMKLNQLRENVQTALATIHSSTTYDKYLTSMEEIWFKDVLSERDWQILRDNRNSMSTQHLEQFKA